jgi:hypothetical protein
MKRPAEIAAGALTAVLTLVAALGLDSAILIPLGALFATVPALISALVDARKKPSVRRPSGTPRL